VVVRLCTVHPNNAECFLLAITVNQRMWTDILSSIKNNNDHVCVTYRETCQKLNFLENDTHWDISLVDASNTAQPH